MNAVRGVDGMQVPRGPGAVEILQDPVGLARQAAEEAVAPLRRRVARLEAERAEQDARIAQLVLAIDAIRARQEAR